MRRVALILQAEDYLQILRRRKWIILACLILCLLGAGAIFTVMPKTYSSSTLILVEDQKIPEKYVSGGIAGNVSERLTLIQQIVMSRSLLSNIIEEFKMYRSDINSNGLEYAIEGMRKKIKVSIVGRGNRVEAFSISFMHEDPMTAMKVTSKLASQFIEENLKIREQLVEGASQFLEQELESAKSALDAREKAISEYKAKFMGELPEQLDTNLKTLDRLQSEKIALDEALQRLTDRLAGYEKTINENEMTGMAYSSPGEISSESPRAPGKLQDLERQLATLSSEYKDSYPDIIMLKKQIADIKAQNAEGGRLPANQAPVVAPSAKKSGAGTVSPRRVDHYQQSLLEQREELKIQIASLKDRQRLLAQQRKVFEGRVERAPINQQGLSAILRDYDNNQKNYQALLEKRINARVSENLEKRQKGEQFRIVDPANLPVQPVSPNPMMFLGGGIVAGFLCAASSIWWLDFRNLPYRRPEEIETSLGLPTLATIPYMSSLCRPVENQKSLEDATKKPQWVQWLAWPGNAAKGVLAAIPWKRKTGSEKQTPAATQANRNALGAEQFRVLAGRIIQLRDKKGARVLAITSSVGGEGKTTLSLALAMTLARDFLEETVLIDGDMRNPSIGRRLGLEEEMGLMNIISGECDLDKALYQHEQPTLKILPAGTSNVVDRIGLPATRLYIQKILDNLRHRGVIVILDGPPILPMADMNLYSEIVDGVLVVIRAVQTPQQVVVDALDFLTGGNIEGAVLNGVDDLRREYYKTYSNSRYATIETPPMFSLPDRSEATRAFGQSHNKSHNGN